MYIVNTLVKTVIYPSLPCFHPHKFNMVSGLTNVYYEINFKVRNNNKK